jgi:hypothetical protein
MRQATDLEQARDLLIGHIRELGYELHQHFDECSGSFVFRVLGEYLLGVSTHHQTFVPIWLLRELVSKMDVGADTLTHRILRLDSNAAVRTLVDELISSLIGTLRPTSPISTDLLK